MMTSRVMAAVSVLLLSGCLLTRGGSGVNGSAEQDVARDLNRLRAATRPYQVLDSAVAAGYTRDVPDCLVHEHHGAMGYHHSNRAHVDSVIDVTKPEILLYERLDDGRYRLNGVEFIMSYRVWPRDSIAPRVLGQQMKRENNLNFWYLHVWAWHDNPDGMYADFHPAIRCAPNAAKVFRPSGG